MKAVKLTRNIGLVLVIGLALSIGVFAQVDGDKDEKKGRDRIAKVETKTIPGILDSNINSSNVDKKDQKVKLDEDDDTKEAKKAVAYYSNYLDEYRLGPNDIISIEVFGQCPDYCKTDASVPPTARMSYPLIREGVFVGGKTVDEVAADVTKKLDEYIIDPQVTVSLVRPGSARYSVMGKVNTPGVRIMDRRVTINEAILEAGGVAKDGTKKKVFIARVDPRGFYSTEVVDLVGIEKGKVPTIFLKPGDQVFVGGKGLTFSKILDYVGKFSAARILFGSPF